MILWPSGMECTHILRVLWHKQVWRTWIRNYISLYPCDVIICPWSYLLVLQHSSYIILLYDFFTGNEIAPKYTGTFFNLPRSGFSYMRHWTRSSLPQPMLICCQLDPEEQYSVNFRESKMRWLSFRKIHLKMHSSENKGQFCLIVLNITSSNDKHVADIVHLQSREKNHDKDLLATHLIPTVLLLVNIVIKVHILCIVAQEQLNVG